MYFEKETIGSFIIVAFAILILWIYVIYKDYKNLKVELKQEKKNNEIIGDKFEVCEKKMSIYKNKSDFNLYRITRTFINSRLKKEDVICFKVNYDDELTYDDEFQNRYDHFESGRIKVNRFNKMKNRNEYIKDEFTNERVFYSETELKFSLFEDYIDEENQLFKIKNTEYPLTHIFKNLSLYSVENNFLTFICKTFIGKNKEVIIGKNYDINILLVENIYKKSKKTTISKVEEAEEVVMQEIIDGLARLDTKEKNAYNSIIIDEEE